jgi:hypothetical protein
VTGTAGPPAQGVAAAHHGPAEWPQRAATHGTSISRTHARTHARTVSARRYYVQLGSGMSEAALCAAACAALGAQGFSVVDVNTAWLPGVARLGRSLSERQMLLATLNHPLLPPVSTALSRVPGPGAGGGRGGGRGGRVLRRWGGGGGRTWPGPASAREPRPENLHATHCSPTRAPQVPNRVGLSAAKMREQILLLRDGTMWARAVMSMPSDGRPRTTTVTRGQRAVLAAVLAGILAVLWWG